jgi:hypothetical protein
MWLAHVNAVATDDVEIRAAKTRFAILRFGVGTLQLALPDLHAEPQYQSMSKRVD